MAISIYPSNETEAGGRGNLIIYEAVKKYPSVTNLENLAALSWMIGRDYAASPERRIAIRGNTDKIFQKIIEDQSIPTYKYDDFFHVLAWALSKQSGLVALDANIQALNSAAAHFKFDFDLGTPSLSSADFPVIKKALHCVLDFDGLLFSALQTIQETIQTTWPGQPNICPSILISPHKGRKCANPTHNVSFSSKFIHFHAPQFVYITDRVTRTNLSARHPNVNKEKDYRAAAGKGFLDVDYQDAYYRHFMRCYSLAKQLSKTYQSNPTSLYHDCTPRAVDIYLSKP
jgi:hypothetical protein